MEHIGKNVKQWRLAQGLGLNELARRAGIDKGNLSKLEAGSGGTSIEKLHHIAEALGIPAAALLRKDFGVERTLEGFMRVPLLAWAQMGINNGETMETQEKVAIEFDASPATFAVKIMGDANDPEYKHDDVVIIDPHEKPVPGEMVMAKDGEGFHIFRRFRDMGGIDDQGHAHFELLALNPLYAPRHSARESLQIVGVCVQHRRNRRTQKIK